MLADSPALRIWIDFFAFHPGLAPGATNMAPLTGLSASDSLPQILFATSQVVQIPSGSNDFPPEGLIWVNSLATNTGQKSGAKARALQTLPRLLRVKRLREAYGVRRFIAAFAPLVT